MNTGEISGAARIMRCKHFNFVQATAILVISSCLLQPCQLPTENRGSPQRPRTSPASLTLTPPSGNSPRPQNNPSTVSTFSHRACRCSIRIRTMPKKYRNPLVHNQISSGDCLGQPESVKPRGPGKCNVKLAMGETASTPEVETNLRNDHALALVNRDDPAQP